MGAGRYTITEGDQYIAWGYLERKLREPDYLPLSVAIAAASQFDGLDIHDHSALTSWCEQHLKRERWTQLKGAIRARRARAKKTLAEKKKSTDLEPGASTMLSYLAKTEGVSISEVLTKYLSQPYIDALTAGDHLG